jgi:hypothetical protein
LQKKIDKHDDDFLQKKIDKHDDDFLQKKIDKRGRKLIDFDKERHNVQQLASNPNRNEAKFARCQKFYFLGKNFSFYSLHFS